MCYVNGKPTEKNMQIKLLGIKLLNLGESNTLGNIPTTIRVKSKPFLIAFRCSCSGRLENPMQGASV